MSISTTQQCPDCKRWLYPGDPGCDCWVEEAEERDRLEAESKKKAAAKAAE